MHAMHAIQVARDIGMAHAEIFRYQGAGVSYTLHERGDNSILRRADLVHQQNLCRARPQSTFVREGMAQRLAGLERRVEAL